MKKIYLFLIVFSLLSCSKEEPISEKVTIEKINELILLKIPNADFQNISIKNEKKNSTVKKGIPEPLYFSSLDELSKFLDNRNLNSSTSRAVITHHSPLDDIGGGGEYESYTKVIDKRLIGLYSYINIRFYVKNCSAEQLTSYLSGNQIGVSYNHLGGTTETFEYSSGGVMRNLIDYSVDGLLNYNIIVEDIGTIFSEYVKYSGTYRCD